MPRVLIIFPRPPGLKKAVGNGSCLENKEGFGGNQLSMEEEKSIEKGEWELTGIGIGINWDWNRN